VPKSNFPDIRRVCYLRALTGTILLVPRSNKEVRLYVPVESGATLSNPEDLTFERIMDAARTIISPYTLEAGSVSWWSAYRVGQRVGNHFSVHNNRAFLAGDAVRTCLSPPVPIFNSGNCTSNFPKIPTPQRLVRA